MFSFSCLMVSDTTTLCAHINQLYVALYYMDVRDEVLDSFTVACELISLNMCLTASLSAGCLSPSHTLWLR